MAADAGDAARVCLITGCGEGTGAATARRFAKAGYAIAMLARDGARLDKLARELGNAKGYVCDVSDLDRLVEAVAEAHHDFGDPTVAIHNAAAGSFQPFLEGSVERFEHNFRVNSSALLVLAQQVAPAMVERGSGAIVVTSNTAALRGVPNYALFAPTKAAQRILAQAMARDLGPKGVHVAYVLIDAAINAPWTRDRIYGKRPEDFFAQPEDIAEEIYHVAHQNRSAWSFDVELRPFGEKW